MMYIKTNLQKKNWYWC